MAVLDQKRPADRQCRNRRLVTPACVFGRRCPASVALPHGVEKLDRSPVTARDQQLEELGMRPHQGHGAAGRPPGKQKALRYRLGVPYLLRQEAAGAGTTVNGAQILDRILAGLQGEMAPFAGEERPGAPDPVAIIGPAIVVFAVAVLVVTAIDRAGRGLDPEDGVGRP